MSTRRPATAIAQWSCNSSRNRY